MLQPAALQQRAEEDYSLQCNPACERQNRVNIAAIIWTPLFTYFSTFVPGLGPSVTKRRNYVLDDSVLPTLWPFKK